MEQITIKRGMMLLSIIILFVLLFVFYMYFYQPLSQTIAAQESEIVILDKEIALFQKLSAEDAQQHEPSFDTVQVQTALPLWDNIEQLLLDIKEIEKASWTNVKSMSFSQLEGNTLSQLIGVEAQSMPPVQELKLALTLEGEYSHIRAWLKQVWELPRLIVIDSLAFATSTTDTKQIIANVGLTTYFDSEAHP